MGDEFGIDASLDGLGLNELEGFIDELADGDMNVIIENIESKGPGMFDKTRFLNLINQYAQDGGFNSVNLAGQCDPGSLGSNMFAAMKTMLGVMGDAGELTVDDDATQLYWVTQS